MGAQPWVHSHHTSMRRLPAEARDSWLSRVVSAASNVSEISQVSRDSSSAVSGGLPAPNPQRRKWDFVRWNHSGRAFRAQRLHHTQYASYDYVPAAVPLPTGMQDSLPPLGAE